jgi:hypothetical protein
MAACGRRGLVVVTTRSKVPAFANKFAFKFIHLLAAVKARPDKFFYLPAFGT